MNRSAIDLVISADAGGLRRALGPMAWVVFEEVLHASQPADTGSTSSCALSVRDVAQRVGLDKDTVARAVQRLVAAGLVARSQDRTTAGTFARTTYLVSIPVGVRLLDHDGTAVDPCTPSTVRASRPARSTTALASVSQLSFLEL